MKIINKFFDRRRRADKGKKKEYDFGLTGTPYLINLADPKYHFLLWDWQFLCKNHHRVPNKAKLFYRLVVGSIRIRKYYRRTPAQLKQMKLEYLISIQANNKKSG